MSPSKRGSEAIATAMLVSSSAEPNTLEGVALAPALLAALEGSFRARVERLERTLLTQALDASAGNQSEAARRLQLSRATFFDKLKRYGIG